jgi:hypothetical protein
MRLLAITIAIAIHLATTRGSFSPFASTIVITITAVFINGYGARWSV